MRGIQTYDFDVTGTGEFPFDMLRYDRCWPKDQGPAMASPRRVAELTRTVRLTGLREPTNGRWESFGWKVTNFKRSFVLESNATTR